jgi:hypothetical protein
MKTYYPRGGGGSEDTAERKKSGSPTEDDLKYITPVVGGTKMVWISSGIDARRYQADEETRERELRAGWEACLKRRIAAEKQGKLSNKNNIEGIR